MARFTVRDIQSINYFSYIFQNIIRTLTNKCNINDKREPNLKWMRQRVH